MSLTDWLKCERGSDFSNVEGEIDEYRVGDAGGSSCRWGRLQMEASECVWNGFGENKLLMEWEWQIIEITNFLRK